MTWSDAQDNETTWGSALNRVILNDKLIKYDVSGVLYNTSGVTYDWYILDTGTNSDKIWSSSSDNQTVWA